MKANGFTLIEMVVVLMVLVLLTHLAVRDLSRVRAAQQCKLANRQLEEIRDAVWQYEAGEDPGGFLADMGRLPRTVAETNSSGEVTHTLSELWRCPAGAMEYAVKAATAENLCVPASEKTKLADGAVFVPTGWRGPYLRLPTGRDRLLDPWGNPLELEDDAGYRRLETTNGLVVAVTHLGADARPDKLFALGSVHDRDATIALAPEGGAKCRLVVSAEVVGENVFSGEITWSWYGPADGMITGAVKTVQYPAPAEFTGLTPGVRIIRDSISKVARRVVIKPGDNLLQFKLVSP